MRNLAFADSVLRQVISDDHPNFDRLRHAFCTVERGRFVDPGFAFRAQSDEALPIGFGQTISKPSTVALMLSLLNIAPGRRILEVGTGSGYASALILAMGADVFGIERVAALGQRAKRLLDELFPARAIIRVGDGRRGWPEVGPFDGILVSAALDEVPKQLLRQLMPGASLVAPVFDGSLCGLGDSVGEFGEGALSEIRSRATPDLEGLPRGFLQRLVVWQAPSVTERQKVVGHDGADGHWLAKGWTCQDMGPCRFVTAN